MRKLSEPHGDKIGPPRHTRVCRRALSALLALLLAAVTSAMTPAAAHANPRHRDVKAVARSRVSHARQRFTHRDTGIAPPPLAVRSSRGETALRFAIAQLGKPYRYGASGPNAYDCSGLAQRAWRAAGVAIPRTTQAQARFGSPVPLSRIQLGDLVIFYPNASHVGIYAGSGNVIVAPHAGKVVTYAAMRWMPIHTIRRPG